MVSITSLSRWRHTWCHWQVTSHMTSLAMWRHGLWCHRQSYIQSEPGSGHKKHSFFVAMTTWWLPWERVTRDFFRALPWPFHHSQSQHLCYYCPKNHLFSVAMETTWLPWKPLPLGSKFTHPRPSCRVWCWSVRKWQRSFRTNKQTANTNCMELSRGRQIYVKISII